MMSLFFADLVREQTWGEGADALPLEGALPGHRAFIATVPAGARFHYAIAGVTRPGEWELGEGELDGDGALLRSPIASSGGGAAVNFSAGLKTVALTVLSDWFAARDLAPGLNDIDGLDEALAGKAPVAHSHPQSDVTGLTAALAGKAALAGAAFGGTVSAPNIAAGELRIATTFPYIQLAPSAWTTAAYVEAGVGPGGAGPGDYLNFNVPGVGHVGFVIGGVTRADFSVAGLALAGPLSIGGAQAIGSRRTGWSAPTGTAARDAFDTSSVTTEGLAQRVKALIDDLGAHGLIGA